MLAWGKFYPYGIEFHDAKDFLMFYIEIFLTIIILLNVYKRYKWIYYFLIIIIGYNIEKDIIIKIYNPHYDLDIMGLLIPFVVFILSIVILKFHKFDTKKSKKIEAKIT